MKNKKFLSTMLVVILAISAIAVMPVSGAGSERVITPVDGGVYAVL
jgi:hypothetical protein